MRKSGRRTGACGADKVSLRSKRTASRCISRCPHDRSRICLPSVSPLPGWARSEKPWRASLLRGCRASLSQAIVARDQAKAQAWLDREGIACPLVSLDDLPDHADLVVECAPAAILDQICRPMLSAGKQVMVLSASALLPRPELVDLARARGGQIIVPTGALIGFDAVSAAAEGTINSVQMVTRKPPTGLAGAPYLIEKRDLSGRAEIRAMRIQGLGAGRRRGISSQCQRRGGVVAGRHRPRSHDDRNLGRSGSERNCHQIKVEFRLGLVHDVDREHPSENPKTGRITALSVIAALRKLTSPLQVGT